MLRPAIIQRYESIREIVERLGYKEASQNPFRFEKIIRSPLDKREYRVELDFLTEPDAAEQLYPFIKVQRDLRACLIQGSSIIFKLNYAENVEGVLPNGGKIIVEIKTANIAGSLTMKGLALPRLNDKDSYDIYTLTGFHGGNPRRASQIYLNHVKTVQTESRELSVINTSLQRIRQAFRDLDSQGPYAVSRFTGQNMNTESYVRVATFLENIPNEFASSEQI